MTTNNKAAILPVLEGIIENLAEIERGVFSYDRFSTYQLPAPDFGNLQRTQDSLKAHLKTAELVDEVVKTSLCETEALKAAVQALTEHLKEVER